ncbi:MAG: hypothetical protein Q9163_002612 [Psora crenata]
MQLDVDIFPKLNESTPKNFNNQPLCSGRPRPLLPKAPFTPGGPSHYATAAGSQLDLRGIPREAAQQVTWIAATIRAIALEEWSVEVPNPSMCESEPTTVSRDTLGGGVNGVKDTLLVMPKYQQGMETVNGVHAPNVVTLHQQASRMPDSPFPPLALDPGLADRVFARRADDSPNDDLRNICGKILIHGLVKGSHSHDQRVARELEATIRSSEDSSPYVAAFKALACKAEVVSAISQAMKGQPPYHDKAGFGPTVPEAAAVPSLKTDDTSGLINPAETIGSGLMHPDRGNGHGGNPFPLSHPMSGNTGTNRCTEIIAPSARSGLKATASSAVGASPGIHATYDGIQNPAAQAERCMSADASAGSSPSNGGLLLPRKSEDPLVNTLNHASAIMYEMSLGAPGQPTGFHIRHESNQGSPSAQTIPISHTSPLHHRISSQYVTPYTELSHENASDEYVEFGGRHTTSEQQQQQPQATEYRTYSDDRNAGNGNCTKPYVTEAVVQKQKEPFIPVKDHGDEGFFTEAQIDRFLALANGGSLEDTDSETDEDDWLAESDRERTISRPVTPDCITDSTITAVLEGIVAELVTNNDHGHGLAFLTPQVADYQSANRQRFAAELQHFVKNAPPQVNVAMSLERSDAIKELYKHICRRVSRPHGRSLHSRFAPTCGPVPSGMPHIRPSPGYQVVYHAPGAPPGALPGMAMQDCLPLPTKTVSALPNPAPARKRKRKPGPVNLQLYEFPRPLDAAVVEEARKRIKERMRKKGWSFATPRLPIKKADLAIVQAYGI